MTRAPRPPLALLLSALPPLLAVSTLSAAGAAGTAAGPAAASEAPVRAASQAPARLVDVPVRSLASTPAHPIAGGKGTAQILFGARDGAVDGALTLLVFQPGAEVPEHVHEASTEILYVLEGEASMTLERAPLTVRAGEAVRIPKGAKHTARVTGMKPFRALQVYAPAGPEERFLPKPSSR